MNTTIPTEQTVWAYARFSTKKQALGDSSTRQEKGAKAFATKRDLPCEYLSDQGISGRHGANRLMGRFGDFLERAEAGTLGPSPILAIENFDRMSREQIHDSQTTFYNLIRAGVTVVTIHNLREYKAPLTLADSLIALVEMDCAWQYSENLSKRISASWDRERDRAALGQRIHRGTCPGWLRQVGDDFVTDSDRVRLLKEIYERYLAGQGTQTLARWLNGAGHAAWTHKGQKSAGWHATSVKNVLRNRAVLGEFTPMRDTADGKRIPAGIPNPVYFPAVIEEKQFLAVQDMLKRVPKRGKPTKTYWNLLADLAFSEIDGSTMWGQKHSPKRQKEVRDYLKSRASIMGTSPDSHFVSYQIVEKRLLALLYGIDADAFKRPNPKKDDMKEAQLRVTRATARVSKYRNLIYNDASPSRSLVCDLKKAEQDEDESKRALTAIREQRIKGKGGKIGLAGINLANPEERARLHATIARTFEKFTFGRNEEGDYFQAWFNEHDGILVPLTGEEVSFRVAAPPNLDDATRELEIGAA